MTKEIGISPEKLLRFPKIGGDSDEDKDDKDDKKEEKELPNEFTE